MEITQSFKRQLPKEEIVMRYFKMVSAFNNFRLTQSDFNLLTHMTMTGHVFIYRKNSINAYSEKYNYSYNSIKNTISKLCAKKMIIKDGTKHVVNPKIKIDFNKDELNFLFTCGMEKKSEKKS